MANNLFTLGLDITATQNRMSKQLKQIAKSLSDRGDIDYDAVNKLMGIIPVMQNMDNKEFAKAIVKEIHNDNKDLSHDASKQTKKSNKERNLKVVSDGEKTE